MQLFEDISRTDPRIASHTEGTYRFLNRVDNPVFERIRHVLNAWFARYEQLQPRKTARDLAARVRAKQPLQFEAAFWELYLHEAHVRLGFEVSTCSEDKRHPDFAMVGRGGRLYLEATVTAKSAAHVPEAPGVAQIYDWINSAYDPNFFVAVEVVATGREIPKRHEVTDPLVAWLSTAAEDWGRLRAAMERGERQELPRTELAIRDWLLELEAFPKSQKARDDNTFPMIGLYSGQAAWQDDSATILRDKLMTKARHYGDLGAPFVVAIHDITPFASRRVVRDALFGLQRPFWAEDATVPNRVSAVLAAHDFGMSSPARKTPELWLNPHATHPLPAGVLPWPIPDDDAPFPSGLDPAALFGLPEDWPGEPFPRRN